MKIYRSLSVLVIGVWALAASITAQASSVLHIGSGSNSSCVTGGCPIYGSEVNPFDGELSLVQNTGKVETYTSLYLVLGAVNDTSGGGALNSGMFGSATLWSGGGSASIGFGPLSFKNLMTSTTISEAYAAAGLAVPNNSNSFTNWSGAEQSVLGIDAKNFGIYTLALNPSKLTALGPNDSIDLKFNDLPTGTFALGWGEILSKKEGSTYQGTPFTESGLETPPTHKVPEPSTLALLSLGFIGLALMRRRSQQQVK